MTLDDETLPADMAGHTARGGLLAMVAQVTRILLQLVLTAILARLLPPKDFGIFAMASVLMAFVGNFMDLGLSAAIVQQKRIDDVLVGTLFYVNFGASLLVMAIAVATAPLAAWFFGDARVTWIVIAMAAGLPIAALGMQHSALLTRSMRWAPVQWTPIAAQLAGGVCAVFLAWKCGAGYWALVAQFLVTIVVTTASMWWFCSWRPSWSFDWGRARSALHFGFHLTSFNLLNYFHVQFDNVLIGWRWGARDLGYYSRAYQLMTLPLTLVQGPVGSAIVPALSRLQDEPERWRRTFLSAFGVVTFISCGLAAMMIAAAYPLVELLFGPNWGPAAHIFTMLSISMFASAPMSGIGWIYLSLGRGKRLFRWGLMLVPLIVFGFWLGLPYGAAGLAKAYSAVMLVTLLPSVAIATWRSPVSAWAVFRILLTTIVPGMATAAICRLLLEPYLGGTGFVYLVLNCAVALSIYLVLSGPAFLYVVRDLSLFTLARRFLLDFRKAAV